MKSVLVGAALGAALFVALKKLDLKKKTTPPPPPPSAAVAPLEIRPDTPVAATPSKKKSSRASTPAKGSPALSGAASPASGSPASSVSGGSASTPSSALRKTPSKAALRDLKNAAFVFVKPHANTEATRALVRSTLEARKIAIVAEGEIDAAAIDEDKLIDQHYYAIASKATLTKPKDLPVPADAFQAKYGVSWQSALDDGKVFNALDACAHFGVDSAGLDAKWQKAKKDGHLVKFGGGFYCGKVEDIYVFNGFFMEMRAAFVAPGASIHYYVVEFEPADCKWAAFRGDVLGPTDPADAPETSLRGMIYRDWKQLGLKSKPFVGENGVHASASPLEGLAVRLVPIRPRSRCERRFLRTFPVVTLRPRFPFNVRFV